VAFGSAMSLDTIGSAGGDRPREHVLRCDRTGVAIAVDMHDTEGMSSGLTRDISPEGLFVATPAILPVGTRLLLLIALPDERGPLAVRAEVRWTRPTKAIPDEQRPAGMGLQFVDPPLGVVLAIAELFASRSE